MAYNKRFGCRDRQFGAPSDWKLPPVPAPMSFDDDDDGDKNSSMVHAEEPKSEVVMVPPRETAKEFAREPALALEPKQAPGPPPGFPERERQDRSGFVMDLEDESSPVALSNQSLLTAATLLHPESEHPPPMRSLDEAATLWNHPAPTNFCSLFDNPPRRPFSAVIERPHASLDDLTPTFDDQYEEDCTAVTGSAASSRKDETPRRISGVPLAMAALGSGASHLFSTFHDATPTGSYSINVSAPSLPTTTSTATTAIPPAERQVTEYSFVPKNELHALYGKHPRRKIISGENYTTFHDGGQAHLLKWSTVFVCPLTGELFLSGKYGGARASGSKNGPLYFLKKSQAEHAAAAWAFDCLCYRDLGDSAVALVGKRLSLEQPYAEKEAKYQLPEGSMPADVVRGIRKQQEEIRRLNGLGPIQHGYSPNHEVKSCDVCR